MRSTWAGGVGRPWVPIREEAYKDLIYLDDAYKRAIIDSQGQEENSRDVENSWNAFFVERTWFDHVLSVGSMISSLLKFRKQNSHGRGGGGGELGKHC